MDFQTLTQAMLQPAAYTHPVVSVQRIDTHISVVFLAGDFAYKLRKPVTLDFLDFSSPAARHADCEQELRLNRRFAPGLYLDVVPIVADAATGVAVGGCGEAIEYAVRMRRFEQRDVLLPMAIDGRLDASTVELLATRVADFHRALPGADADAGYGTPARVEATFEECAASVVRLADRSALALRATQAVRARIAGLRPAFGARLRGGHVREGHGDLHLGNVVMFDGPTLFDCLEFDPKLRWSDTIYDAGFMFMDLLAHGRRAHAWRFINAYLERSGDYPALVLLPFYAGLRALVRARVMLETARQQADGEPSRAAADAFLALALELVTPRAGRLILMHGVSGSGKSTIAARIAKTRSAIRVRSDVERKRLRESRETPADSWYAEREVERVYRRMRAICKLGAQAGFTMIADATFLARAQRRAFIDLGRRLGVPVTIAHCEAEPDELRRRVAAREQQGADASEAGLAVLEQQLRMQDAFDADERPCVVGAETLIDGR